MASASRGPTAPRGAESSAPPAPAYGRCLPWVGSQASRMSKSWTLCPRSPGQHEDKISALGSLAPPEQDRQGGAPEPPIEQVLQAHGRHRARRLVLTGSRDRGREPPAGGPRAGGLGTRVGARQRRPQRQPERSNLPCGCSERSPLPEPVSARRQPPYRLPAALQAMAASGSGRAGDPGAALSDRDFILRPLLLLLFIFIIIFN